VTGLLAFLLAVVPAFCEESDGFVLYPPGEAQEENEKIKQSCRNEGERYFSVAAMFVGFREALEACVIISVRIQHDWICIFWTRNPLNLPRGGKRNHSGLLGACPCRMLACVWPTFHCTAWDAMCRGQQWCRRVIAAESTPENKTRASRHRH
jgi:hypothetical protein